MFKKTYPYKKGKYVYITRLQLETIAINSSECWICNKILCNCLVVPHAPHTPTNSKIYYIDYGWLVSEEFLEHFEQLLGNIMDYTEFEEIVIFS